MTRRFSGVVTLEGMQTGDGRFWVPGAFTWMDLPIPLGWLPEDMHGDGGAGGPSVGVIDQLSRNPQGEILVGGMIDDQTPDGAEIVRRMEEGTAPFGNEWGISVDLDDVEFEVVLTKPADEEAVVLMASARPLAGRADTSSIVAAAGDPDPTGEVVAADSADAVVLRFLRSRIRGATLVNMPAFDGARIMLEDPAMPQEETPVEPPAMVAKVLTSTGGAAGGAANFVTVNYENQPTREPASVFNQGLIVAEDGEPIMAAGFPITPPVQWFDDPLLADPTPLTVEENGRVYGHIATFDRCHVGMSGCTLAPRSGRAYDLFLTGAMRCAEGCSVKVGTITTNIPHAPQSLDATATAAHYDDTRAAAAYVAVGEDEFGIWVAGTVRPDLSEAQIVNLRAAKPSGDWRPIQGKHELVAVLMVNTPGFPVARPIAASAVPQEVLDMAAERIDRRFVKGLDEKFSQSAAIGD